MIRKTRIDGGIRKGTGKKTKLYSWFEAPILSNRRIGNVWFKLYSANTFLDLRPFHLYGIQNEHGCQLHFRFYQPEQ